MKRIYPFYLLTFVLILNIVNSSFCQSSVDFDEFSLSGYVYSPEGGIIEGAEITLISNSYTEVVVSDASGYYEFDIVPFNDELYTLVGESAGFCPFSLEFLPQNTEITQDITVLNCVVWDYQFYDHEGNEAYVTSVDVLTSGYEDNINISFTNSFLNITIDEGVTVEQIIRVNFEYQESFIDTLNTQAGSEYQEVILNPIQAVEYFATMIEENGAYLTWGVIEGFPYSVEMFNIYLLSAGDEESPENWVMVAQAVGPDVYDDVIYPSLQPGIYRYAIITALETTSTSPFFSNGFTIGDEYSVSGVNLQFTVPVEYIEVGWMIGEMLKSDWSYEVYRFHESDLGNPEAWTLLSTIVDDNIFIDSDFSNITSGLYYYGVKAVSEDIESVTSVSDPVSLSNLLSSTIQQKNEISVYPNPVEDMFHIASQIDIKNVVIYDVSGEVVLNKKENSNKSININTLSSGVYFLVIVDVKSNIHTQKLIIQ